MAKVPNAVEILPENLNRLSRVHERYRQTDRQTTDGRAIAYSEQFTFANKIILSGGGAWTPSKMSHGPRQLFVHNIHGPKIGWGL